MAGVSYNVYSVHLPSLDYAASYDRGSLKKSSISEAQ
jgi:hypothetical protein